MTFDLFVNHFTTLNENNFTIRFVLFLVPFVDFNSNNQSFNNKFSNEHKLSFSCSCSCSCSCVVRFQSNITHCLYDNIPNEIFIEEEKNCFRQPFSIGNVTKLMKKANRHVINTLIHMATSIGSMFIVLYKFVSA